jgi:RNA polymerase sigma-70 factor (ECF subfamily)
MKASRRSSAPPSPAPADERLLIEAAKVDPAKFGELYETHFSGIYAFIVTRVRNRATAEDLTSDVFGKALEHLPGYEYRGTPFSAWLLRIAVNIVIDHAKHSGREITPPDDPPEPPTQTELRFVEDFDRLLQFVRQLPEAQRQVIRQRFIEQRSIREIAQTLGKTDGAIKQLQLRALEQLRRKMEGGHA